MFRNAFTTGMCAALLCAISLNASAQDSAAITSAYPPVTAYVGDIFEVSADTALPMPTFSWILTKDREFLSAQRARFFQTRQGSAGNFLLDGSIQDAQQTRTENISLVLAIRDRDAVPVPPTAPEAPQLFLSPSPDADQTIRVLPMGSFVRMEVVGAAGSFDRVTIDLDSAIDSDGDGNPKNDADNAGSLNERSGSPIFFLFRPEAGTRVISITASLSGSEIFSSEFPVTFTGEPDAGDIGSGSASALAIDIDRDGRTIRPRVAIDATMADPALLFYEWNFGDDVRSMLTRPTHTYTADGTYQITLVVRNIRTGETMFSGQTTERVEGAAVVPPPGDNTPSDETPADDGRSIVGILTLLFGILFILGIAIGVFILLRRLQSRATSGIQKGLEKMEGKLFPDQQKTSVVETPAASTLTLRREVPAVSVVTKNAVEVEEEKPLPEKNTPLSVDARPEVTPEDAGPVPDWLKPQVMTPVASSPSPNPSPSPSLPSFEESMEADIDDSPAGTVIDEKERERRRKKRQRYRENKRLREAAEKTETISAVAISTPPQSKEAEVKTAPVHPTTSPPLAPATPIATPAPAAPAPVPPPTVSITPSPSVDVSIQVRPVNKETEKPIEATEANKATKSTPLSNEQIATIRVESLNNDGTAA